ncbi:MAG: hypothetical protein IT422_10905 [Pirellulaceae bacterium]|nr:hypothetical protein [Pirellulaceae bacterium]
MTPTHIRRSTRVAFLLAFIVVPTTVVTAQNSEAVFAQRGYYFTFCRMPTYGLAEWKDILDCVHEDNGNTVILWMGGAFRSKTYPITWEYNRDHKNVQADFVHELIDYAHSMDIRVLLGITPFGYDGVNQYYKVNSNTIATQLNGEKVNRFGIHSWGYNMCASNSESQSFMFGYVHEMMSDFYSNSDGLLIESSDYAVCYCDACWNKFFDHEFQWVRKISDDIWSGNPNATIIVYPRYFVDAEVPVLGVPGSRHELDPRWTLFFTPHSAHIDKELISKAKSSIWWDDSTALRRPEDVQRNARIAQAAGVSGYIPSLETFSYVATEPEAGQPWLHGRRHVPLGMGWLASTQHPYRELPIKIQRSAYRIFSSNPNASNEQFRAEIGREYFDDRVDEQNIDDLLAIQDIFALERTWYQPSPIVCIERCRALKDAGGLTPETRKLYLDRLNKLKEIAERHEHSEHTTEREMCHLIDWVLKQWDPEAIQLLTTE